MQLGRKSRRRASALALIAASSALACAWPAFLTPPARSGAVEGRVVSRGSAAPRPWVVVYLEGAGLEDATTGVGPTSLLRGREGALDPPVLAVAAGQRVSLASDDGLHHRFFSSSRPQGFEPVDVPTGQRRSVLLTTPGVVRVYCSLHPGERGTIIVAPTRHFSVLRSQRP